MLRWSRRATFLFLPACFNPNYDHPACGPHGECPSGFSCSAGLVCERGSLANPLDATSADAPMCFGKVFPICFPASAVPTASKMLDGLTEINTDMTAIGSACDRNNDQKERYCVVVGAGLTLPAGATLTAHGDRAARAVVDRSNGAGGQH